MEGKCLLLKPSISLWLQRRRFQQRCHDLEKRQLPKFNVSKRGIYQVPEDINLLLIRELHKNKIIDFYLKIVMICASVNTYEGLQACGKYGIYGPAR